MINESNESFEFSPFYDEDEEFDMDDELFFDIEDEFFYDV